MFNKGDKIKRIDGNFGSTVKGGIYTYTGESEWGIYIKEDSEHRSYSPEAFELHTPSEDVPPFPCKIAVENLEQFVAAQKWVMQFGATWVFSDHDFINSQPEARWLYIHRDSTLGWDRDDAEQHLKSNPDYKNWFYPEIVPTFETKVTGYELLQSKVEDELVEFNGKKYSKVDLEKALSLLTPKE